MGRIPIGRIIAGTIAVLLFAASGRCYLQYRRLDRLCSEWYKAQPGSIPVDLSKPGTYTGALVQTPVDAHAEYIDLEVGSGKGQTDSPKALLSGLMSHLVIRDDQGSEVRSWALNGAEMPDERREGPIPLVCILRGLPPGRYTVTLTVSQGAPKLAGVPQRLVATYLFCGLERWPAKIAGGASLIALVPAVVITGSLVMRCIRAKARAKRALKPADADRAAL